MTIKRQPATAVTRMALQKPRGCFRIAHGSAYLVIMALVASPPSPAIAVEPGAGRTEPTVLAEPAAWTEPAALAEAVATHRSVEVGAYRSERTEVWAYPDGSLLEVHHQLPFREFHDGHWVSLATTGGVVPIGDTTSESSWTMVDSGYPEEAYWNFDGERHERIGLCPVDDGDCQNSKVKRLFYALPTPYRDGRLSILSATFQVTMVHTFDRSARGVSLYRTGDISPDTNWNNQPGGPGWAGASFQDSVSPVEKRDSCTASNQNVEFTATVAIQEAAARNRRTTTFGLKADDETDHHWVKRFCDNAILAVRYRVLD